MKKLSKISILLLVGLLVFTGCSDKNDKKLDQNSDKKDSIQAEKKTDDPSENASNNSSNEKDEDSSNEEQKMMRCTRTGTVTTGVTADLTYEVTYRGLYVDQVHTVEKLMTENDAYLNLYKTKIEEGYKDYKDVEHYNYEIVVKDGVLTSTVDIDYSKIDTDKMIEIDPNNAILIQNGKVKVSDMKSLYQTTGATCE